MEQINEQQESTNLTLTVKNLWIALSKTAAKIKELNAENKELQLRADEIEKLWVRYNELKEQLPVLEEKSALNDKLSEENTRLKKENYHLQTSLSELREIEKSFRLAQVEFTNKNKLLHENAQTIGELKSKISDFELKQKEYNEKLANALTIEEDNEKLILELNNLNKEIELKSNEILKLSSDLSENSAEVKRLKSVKLSYEETIEALNKEFSELEKKARIKEEENLILSDKLTNYDETLIILDDLRVKHQELIDKNRNIEIQYNYVKSDLEEKSKLAEELSGKLSTQDNLIAELLDDIENKDHEIKLFKEAEGKTINLITEKTELVNEKVELNKMIEILKNDLVESKLKADSANEHKIKYEQLLLSYDELNLNSKLLTEELEAIAKEKTALLSKIENMEMELENNIRQTENLKKIRQDSRFLFDMDDKERIELLKSVENYISELEKIV